MTFVEFIPFILFFFLMAMGMAVAFSLGISGAFGIYLILGPEAMLGVLQSIPYRTTASFVLVSIGMFILMAEFASQSGITARLFGAANACVGHLRGGLGTATILASAAFGALSGSSVAATATMSRVAVPEMIKRGYSRKFAAGTASIAGTLAVIIPPSIPLIIYGILTETSVNRLLIGGLIPALLTVIAYVVVIAVSTRINPSMAPVVEKKASWAERWQQTRFVWPFLLTISLIFLALYSGAVTTTEASAVGAILVLLLWSTLGRVKSAGLTPVSFMGLREAFRLTLRTTVMIVVLLIGAYIFSFYLINSGLTHAVVSYVSSLDVPRVVILVCIVCIYLFLGLFMSQLEIMVLTLPFVFPLVINLGYDPIWFGIIVTKTIEIGLVTPPVGMNVFVVAASSDRVSIGDGFKGVTPFLLAELLLLALLIAVPELVTVVTDRM